MPDPSRPPHIPIEAPAVSEITSLAGQGLRQVAKDMPSYAIANASQAVGGFVGLLLFTRWLSPSDYGTYALALTTAAVIDAVFFSWVNNAMLRYLPDYERDQRAEVFLATSFATSLVLLVVTAALWLGSTSLIGGGRTSLSGVVEAGLLVLLSRIMYSFALALVRVRRQTIRYAVYNAVSGFGSVILAVLLKLTVGAGVNSILLVTALAMLTPGAFELSKSGAFRWLRRLYISSEALHKSLLYGLPLAGASFGALILSVADRYMLAFMRGSSDVGSYSAGYDLADKTLKLLFTVLVASSFPVVMETLARRGRVEAHHLIGRLLRAYAVWMVPITALMIGLRDEVVHIALGERFQRAGAILPWVAVGTLCWGAAQILAQGFQVEENTAPLLYWLLAAAAVNVGLNLWLIPAYGVIGAAIATTVAYGAYLAILGLKRIRSAEYPLELGDTLRPLLAGVAMYAAIMAVSAVAPRGWASSSARAVLGLSVYALALWLVARTLFEDSRQQLFKWMLRR
jgi:O-antigen/teichoic acid export membrane protein